MSPRSSRQAIAENPAVRSLLEDASIPLSDIFAQNAAMNDGAGSAEDSARQASERIESHRDMVDGWLAAAREAA